MRLLQDGWPEDPSGCPTLPELFCERVAILRFGFSSGFQFPIPISLTRNPNLPNSQPSKIICFWRDAILGKGPLILRCLREQFQSKRLV